jgi:hypothetical protein
MYFHFRSVSCQQDYGEIYSLAVDEKYLLTGHTLTTTCVQLWNINEDNILPNSTMRETSSESIIWNLHLAFPLALVCRDNETLDVYHLVSEFYKKLKEDGSWNCSHITPRIWYINGITGRS